MPAKAKTAVQDGETFLVDKGKIPPKFIELSEKAAQKALAKESAPREKKPLSEKQKENLQRLIELNKKRREEKLAAARVNVDDLGEIPEDKVIIKVVKGKGAGRKPGRPPKHAPSESDHEVVEEAPVLPPIMPKVKPQPKHQPEPEPEPESEPSPPKVRKPQRGRALERETRPTPKPKPVRRSYYSETSETSGVDADSESESEDEEVVKHKVAKYVEKTKARMEALRQIEQQLKPTNKYSAMSIF
jgi:hypothetical protein